VQVVVAGPAVQRVDPGATPQVVAVLAAEQRVVAIAAPQLIYP
jgi:hypothetical protein